MNGSMDVVITLVNYFVTKNKSTDKNNLPSKILIGRQESNRFHDKNEWRISKKVHQNLSEWHHIKKAIVQTVKKIKQNIVK